MFHGECPLITFPYTGDLKCAVGGFSYSHRRMGLLFELFVTQTGFYGIFIGRIL